MRSRLPASVGPSPRVLILGLDMGDGALLRHWSMQGRLPHFASLLARGTWFDLDSTAQVLHTSTWPTFATGTQPGRHGVYYPYQPKPGSQQAQHIQPDQYGTPPFWQLAAAAGHRCLVYDVPETFPAAAFRGWAVFEWGTWAWYGTPSSQPTALLKELQSRFGPYPLGLEAKRLGLRLPNLSRLQQRLLRSVEYKRTTLQWLLDQEAWDLAVVGFCETHPAGHYLWPATADAIWNAGEAPFQALYQVYAAIDRALGSLHERLADTTALIILSGDGIRPNRCAWHLLPAVLERLGYTRSATSGAISKGSSPAPSLLGRIKHRLPAGARRWIADRLPWWLRDHVGARLQAAAIDWSHTRAFPLPTDLEGCIRINLKGREPHGIVEPGTAYAELCQEIRVCLEELTHPTTGAPAVRRVWIRDDVFPGERQEHLPDLIVTWNDAAPFTALASPRFGHIAAHSPDPRPGTHSPYGFLLASGGGIPAGQQGYGRLVDVAPTVLHLLGCESCEHMDGQPLAALLPAVPTRDRNSI